MSAIVRFFTGRKCAADLTRDLKHALDPYFPDANAKDTPPSGAGSDSGSGGGGASTSTSKDGTGAPAPPMGDKTLKLISTTLSELKVMLYGDDQNEPKPDNTKRIMDDFLGSELLLVLLQQMRKFEFEARKDVAAVYTYALKNRKEEAVSYFLKHPAILQTLVNGYTSGEVALQCGVIFRNALRHESLCAAVLNQPSLFDLFFGFVLLPTFDIASDAFAIFKLLLTKHKTICPEFLEKNSDYFFSKYNGLLQCNNYVTKRQSLRLLGDILMDPLYYGMMIKYVTSAQHLKVILMQLKATTKAVQMEAFHVFKIFIANPHKSRPVIEILLLNKEKLIKFIGDFKTDHPDNTFAEDKKILLDGLAALNKTTLQNTLPPPAFQPAHPVPGVSSSATTMT